MDQSFLRGVGNIYADESLWRAKIHPARLGAALKKERLMTLHRVLQEILQKQSCCAAPRSPIFLMLRASRVNISGTIGLTGAKVEVATAAAP